MNIAIVCYPTYGGSGVVATELGLELAHKGHQVHFVTYSQPVRLELLNKNIHFHEVHVPEYPLFQYQPYELALSSKLVEVTKQHNIEVLHVHYAIPHAYAGYMAKQMLKEAGIDLPMVTTLHGTDITLVGNHPFYKEAVTFSINNSDAVTAVSQSLKEDTLRLFTIRKEIEVIPNFIEIDKALLDKEQPCQRSWFAGPEERIISHISNFRKVKRIPDVIRVFDKVQKILPAKLLMVGDGPEKEAAEELCEELGITDKVIFLGKSSEINKIMCYSDLFLLPSETESFGLAALEAMAHGVPVVSTNSGGLPEVNKHEKSGLLCEVGDIESLSHNVIEILQDDEILRKYKKNAFEVAKTFDIINILPTYESLYTKVIKG